MPNVKNGASRIAFPLSLNPHVVLASMKLAPERDGIRAKVTHNGNTQQVIRVEGEPGDARRE
jgi:hypothetical protein